MPKDLPQNNEGAVDHDQSLFCRLYGREEEVREDDD